VSVRGLRLDRDVLEVRGPDAEAYLDGQLSQDVGALQVGGSAFSLLLQPQGKVDAWLRVTRVADDAFVLDVDGGWGEAVTARLRRFLLRVKVEIAPLDWAVLAVRDADLELPEGVHAVVGELPGGFDLLGPADALPEVEALDAEEYEALRIRAGVPRMGSELDESTIPAAAGVVDRSVSFTKGCYTGQELVARIDSRGGSTPTRLRTLEVTGAPVGAAVVVGDDEVGRVTSAAGDVAMAYVRRAVEPPADAVVRWEGGEAAARIL
jgi:folate-binding protein YgfZ